ncbi:hypothetical protein DVA85_28460 [Acinetobacter sp. RIT592]|nr:hypothetical protein DVA85_28460 [Acinetobacter sp. RIT592]
MKFLLFITVLFVSLLAGPLQVKASSSINMQDLEEELTRYLNDPTITPGTQKYQSFLINQLMYNQDEELATKENYSNLVIYMSGYINNMTLQDDDFYEQTIEDMELAIKNQEGSTSRTISRMPSFVNPSAVQEYASKWWNNRNPDFPNFPDANCVNYTSQLLLAGGINKIAPAKVPDIPINMDPNFWYSYKSGDSPSTYSSSVAWINVTYFYNFWKESQEIIQPSTLNAHRDLEIGDVIQLQHNTGGDYYHSMVVIDKDSSTVYLTGNSNDRERMDIRNITGNNIRAIKFTRPEFNNVLPNLSTQAIRPHLNRTLAVTSGHLGTSLTGQVANFIRSNTISYVPEKNAYRITSQVSGGAPIFWTGESGVGNLRTVHPTGTSDQKKDHDLWLLEPLPNGLFIIRSWINPSMVWDVHNYNPNDSTPVKIERLHSSGTVHRNAQMFFLEAI